MYLLQRYLPKSVRMMGGFALIALGIAVAKQSYCLAPWHVFNDGLSHVFPITIGQANIIVGAVILVMDLLLRQTFGLGTVLNICLVGVFTDFYLAANDALGILPKVGFIPLQILFCLLSVVLNGLGIYLYMSARMGAGPRDALIVFLTKRLPFPVGACKLSLEAVVCLVGWLIGGEVGVGSFLYVIWGGPVLQFVLRRFHFDVKAVKNESVLDTCQILFRGRRDFED